MELLLTALAVVALLHVAGFVGWLVGTGAVAIGMLLVGLPVSFILRKLECEDPDAYALAGAMAGFLVPCLPVLIAEGAMGEDVLFFAVPGMVAGATAGFVWGRWREGLGSDEDTQEEPPPARDRGERWLR